MTMKKTYLIPTIEITVIQSDDIMVPNQMSNPSLNVGANNYALGEEEEEDEYEWSDKLNNNNSRLWY